MNEEFLLPHISHHLVLSGFWISRTDRHIVVSCCLICISLSQTEWSLLFPRQTIQYHGNPSLCPDQYSQRSWSWMVLWRPTRHSRTNTKERCAFHHRGLECKSRKLRDTWITGKIGLGVQNEAGQSLSEFHQENTLVTANTFFQQHKRDSTHGHHHMTNTESRLIIFFSAKNGEALYCQHKQDWSWLWLR